MIRWFFEIFSFRRIAGGFQMNTKFLRKLILFTEFIFSFCFTWNFVLTQEHFSLFTFDFKGFYKFYSSTTDSRFSRNSYILVSYQSRSRVARYPSRYLVRDRDETNICLGLDRSTNLQWRVNVHASMILSWPKLIYNQNSITTFLRMSRNRTKIT